MSLTMTFISLKTLCDSKKLAWVKWSNILASPDKGGLGVGSLKAFNISLLLEWRWFLFHYTNALWVHVVKAIHGDGAGIDIRACHTNGVWASIVGPVNVERTKVEFDALMFDIANLEPEELVDFDTYIWSLSHDNKFSMNSVRKHIDELSLPSLSPSTRWFCNVSVESSAHTFFSYDTASAVWHLVRVSSGSMFPSFSLCGEWDLWFQS
uniref:RNA-directed DNA polymerase, eukaryota, reverse transcriptase zinc-binding domain protein n=1 Tax=Tanacetum cinerariifolium TaxID=118510 RepID=A0A699J9G8_TANCI|nr:RNA-directed DNA polymerase, eukaryota, reverse transcriptase zinc-binding domain protein [Tanacetum cinerariifolium]